MQQNNLFDISNKTFLVTGATGQIGKSICKYLIQYNAIVIGWDINDSDDKVENVDYFKVDITNKKDVDSELKKYYENNIKIDVFINNAGVSTFKPFEERTEEDFDWVMDINLKGTFFCIQKFVKYFDLFKQKDAIILNIASFYGLISPDARIYTDCDRKNSEIYGATKAGVIQMTKYFATHLASRNIRVNSISPGGIFNPINPQGSDFIKNFSYRCPMQRMGNVEELLGAINYFSSNASTYTTGQNLVIDGGMSAW